MKIQTHVDNNYNANFFAQNILILLTVGSSGVNLSADLIALIININLCLVFEGYCIWSLPIDIHVLVHTLRIFHEQF